MQRRMRGKVLLAVGVVGAVAAILILLTTVGEQSTQAAVAQSASEGFSTVGVVHARFLDASGRVKVEEWLDKRTGATRRVELGGVGGDQITVQDGRTIVSWNSRGLGAVWEARAIDPNDPWLEDASNLLRFRTALRSGRARVIGSATVQGKPTWVVKPEPRFGEETPVAVDVRAYLDKETLLPARILVRRGKDELSVPIVVEEAPEGTVPDSSFVPQHEPERGQALIQQQRLRLADAASAAPFPIFTLGRAYDGLQISRLTLDKRSDSRAPFPLEPRIFFGYARGSIDGTYELDLTERRADGEQAQRELAAHRGEGTQHDVVIDGVERPAYVLVGDGKPVYFGVVADGTLITGRANLAVSDTLAMLESLRRLN